MRRIGLIAFVAFALVAVAAPVAAKSVYNEQYREVVVEAGWSSGDYGDAVIVSGYAGARHRKGADTGEIYVSQSVGTPIMCDAGTPDDPDDDYLAYQWEGFDGWGPATVSVSKSYSTGTATATVQGWTYSYNECGWFETENGGGDPVTMTVAMDLTGTGATVRVKGSNSFHIPGEYNEHTRSSSTYRSGVGTVAVDGTPFAAYWGMIGEYQATTHVNAK